MLTYGNFGTSKIHQSHSVKFGLIELDNRHWPGESHFT